MPLRVPPGRAGRIWLAGRLQTARRGVDLLDRKRRALLREQAAVRARAAAAEREWRAASDAVRVWSARSVLLDGATVLERLPGHVSGDAAVTIGWHNLMGAALPGDPAVTVPRPPDLGALGASSATIRLAAACAEATHAAARHAAVRRADDELSVQLARTARRLRALRERWIPQYEEALARLDLALDENQREQAARVRRLTGESAAADLTAASVRKAPDAGPRDRT